jgi:mannose-6-phosphate isomerase-like protein (cupin superfamily)
MLIRAADRPYVEAPADDLVMRALLRAGESPELSVTHVRLAGRHRPLRTLRSTRVYVVLEGSAEFVVGSADPVRAEAGDVVLVPRGERYSLAGELSYLVINTPAYVDGDDLYDE